MGKEKKKIVQISLRIEEEKLRKYKKWLIDNGYKSINQHLNEIISALLEKGNLTVGKDHNKTTP